ncbi:hypothetical protein [Scopulibacillus darangshiensis]|uniref:hypothetical protein n=1 Tax=Scopulibacillus darangshiensis TaxID=442528 RepID=UPI00104595A9|nr:hypothetical protein [Scopulibacillus darangshiensis]
MIEHSIVVMLIYFTVGLTMGLALVVMPFPKQSIKKRLFPLILLVCLWFPISFMSMVVVPFLSFYQERSL